MKKVGLALILAVCSVLGAVVAFQAAPARASSDKVTLCHLADGPAQAGLITVAAAAAYHGHYLQHSADIIPPFEYQGQTYSLNWTGAFPEECGGDTPPTTTEEPPTTTDEEECPPGTHPPSDNNPHDCVPDNPQPPDPPETEDVCPNLGGDQTTVPVGFELKGRLCVQPDKPPKSNKPPGTPVGDCVVQANRELLCGEQG